MHVPIAFSRQRPSFRYTLRDHGNEPLTSVVPTAGFLHSLRELSQSEVSLLPSVTSVAHLFADEASPKALADWTSSDTPIISLHITQFSDATCVGLKVPHSVLDGGSIRIVIHGWTKVLTGTLPPPLNILGYTNVKEGKKLAIDALSAIAEGRDGTEAATAPYLLRGFSYFVFIILIVVDIIWNKREKKRLIHLPKAFVEALRYQAMGGLSEGERVSSSSVVAAWLAKTAYPHRRYPFGLTYVHLFDTRGRSDRLPVNPLGNLALRTFAWIDTSGASSNVQEGARAIQQSVKLHTSSDEVCRQAAFRIARLNGGHDDNLYRIGNSQILFGSSWEGMKIHETDWSEAISERKGPAQETRPRWVFPIMGINGVPERNSSIMYCDREGAFWIQLNLREKDWSAIEQELAGQVIVVK